jgi:DNA modification methylase
MNQDEITTTGGQITSVNQLSVAGSIGIEKVRPYERNAKKHDKKQIKQIAKSIEEFGFNQPVELISYAIVNSTKADDIVLDLFGGSGSTMIACEKMGRIAYIQELDPKYVDVIIKRWENYTGNKAVKIE